MQDDRISIELRLPGLKVLGVKEEEYWIEVLAQYRNEHCGARRRTTSRLRDTVAGWAVRRR